MTGHPPRSPRGVVFRAPWATDGSPGRSAAEPGECGPPSERAPWAIDALNARRALGRSWRRHGPGSPEGFNRPKGSEQLAPLSTGCARLRRMATISCPRGSVTNARSLGQAVVLALPNRVRCAAGRCRWHAHGVGARPTLTLPSPAFAKGTLVRTTVSRRTGEQETAGEHGLCHRACGDPWLPSFTCSTVPLLACSVAPEGGYREKGKEPAHGNGGYTRHESGRFPAGFPVFLWTSRPKNGYCIANTGMAGGMLFYKRRSAGRDANG
jgi:hypothetical protein